MATGDATLLTTALQNLVNNAIAHTPPGGHIRIMAEESASSANLHVIDDGDGIGPEHLETIFDRFTRGDAARDRSGGRVGLGLSIVRGIARLHGGSVSVESQIGFGAHFRLSIPKESAAQAAKPAPAGDIESGVT